jgi:hypothetical protein
MKPTHMKIIATIVLSFIVACTLAFSAQPTALL